MIQNLTLTTESLQAEMIVSDIPHSGKVYLRGLKRLGDNAPGAQPQDAAAELSGLLAEARRLALALKARMLLAGFIPTGPVPMPTPDSPPDGFVFHTGFIQLTGSIRTLAKAAASIETASDGDRSRAASPRSAVSESFELTPLSTDRIDTFLTLHREGMRGVPNVPTLLESDVLKQMKMDRLFLIETKDGTPVGFCDLAVDSERKAAELEEIAILPAWRSKGIGRQVIANLADGLAAEGIDSLSVLVATVNTGALRLYRRLGFDQEQFYANWFRQPLDRREAIGPIHTRNELVADLKRLGVSEGQTLLVHSSMKSLGWIPGGPVALIEALLEAVGPTGTIVMPAQSGDNSDPAHWIAPPVPKDYWPIIRDSMPAYDPRITPTRAIGRVAELFRTWPGALRSGHPSCSFAALGPNAPVITAEHPLANALGEESPTKRLIDLGASVLQIGTDFDTCTLMHLAEYQTRCRPRTKQGAAISVEGQRVWQFYEDIQLNSDEFVEPGRVLEQRGLVTKGKVGEADCRLFKASDAIETACDWFSIHRMKRLTEQDRDWLMTYLSHEPDYNLFLIGDIENFGFDAPFQDLLSYRRPESLDRIDSVLLRYHNNFIVYSDHDDFDLTPVLSGLDYPGLNVLSAKKSVMDQLKPHLEDYHFREMYLVRRPVSNQESGTDLAATAGRASAGNVAPVSRTEEDGIVLATLADADDLAGFLHSIEEFRQINTSLEQRREEMNRSLGGTGTRYVLIREGGQIVACAGTTAENSRSAMVVGVATSPDRRGRGYATRLVSRLCALHQAEGRDALCLFYDNPAAGSIYRRLGFTDVGTWVMATPPKRL